jgi:hypothetical protein
MRQNSRRDTFKRKNYGFGLRGYILIEAGPLDPNSGINKLTSINATICR